MTIALCRRRIGGAVLRSENFGDLITADHKVLCEGCECRINHQCAIVVQDLATQRTQSYLCTLGHITACHSRSDIDIHLTQTS